MASSMPLINFETANRYLTDKALPNRALIPDELKSLQARIAELNPQDPNAATLSAHRKGFLEKEIAKLFQTIEKKLHPVHVPSSQIIQQHYDALGRLAAKLPLNYEQLRKELKNLHSDIRDRIYYAIWLAHGAPQQHEFSTEKLESDSQVLVRSYPPFFSPEEGPLLKQIREELAIEYQLAVLGEQIKELQGSTQVAVKQAELDDLNLRFNAQKEAIFQMHFSNSQINHRQMKHIFKSMPDTVKARLPKPPYFGRGIDVELYKTLGAHYDSRSGMTTFRVFAPNAKEIKLNLSAWGNVEHSIAMTREENGVWEAKTEHAKPGRTYHFMIVGKHGGEAFKKIDPFAFGNHIHSRESGRENHESVVRDIDKDYHWNDGTWIANRAHFNPAKAPMSIYEVHTPTWKKKDNGDSYNWRELAPLLAKYVKDMGYTHVELMALLEHPQPISMGYQITNFFTINSSMGSIEDFQYFVNYFHEQGLGVIADWVPAHFAIDAFALGNFDGSPIFEDDNPSFATHPQWGTYEFNFKKKFTIDFLGSNLEFLLSKLHLDGVRVDAVQSILNLNYGRAPGARSNIRGHDVNLEAKAFLRNTNEHVHKKYPGVLMIAEEAGGWANLTRSPDARGVHNKMHGIGFDLTWHMGFMNNILEYMSVSPQDRSSKYSMFKGTIKDVDYNEDSRPRGNVVLPFSHDENANGKGTIFYKMGGNNPFDKFANGRLLLAFQLLRGGGPVLDFMGNEILQTQEWHGRLKQSLDNPNERNKPSVQWEELDSNIDVQNHQYHHGARESRRALLGLYNRSPGLWDQSDAGFAWIAAEDSHNSVVSFHRRGRSQQFACVFNSSGNDVQDYILHLPNASYAPELDKLREVKEVYNTDDRAFGGGGRLNPRVEIIRDGSNRPTALKLRLPPFTAIVLEEKFA